MIHIFKTKAKYKVLQTQEKIGSLEWHEHTDLQSSLVKGFSKIVTKFIFQTCYLNYFNLKRLQAYMPLMIKENLAFKPSLHSYLNAL